jgi:hypothetical protein
MAMYLAQATGASIVTDSLFRWRQWWPYPMTATTDERLKSFLEAAQMEAGLLSTTNDPRQTTHPAARRKIFSFSYI